MENGINTMRVDLEKKRNKEEILPMAGNFLRGVRASSLQVEVSVHVNEQNADPIPLSQGEIYPLGQYNEIFFSNIKDTGAWIDVQYGFLNKVQFNNPDIAFKNVSISKATELTAHADVSIGGGSSKEILPTNSLRRYARITSLASNGDTIRVGDGSVAADQGEPVAPGSKSSELKTTDTIHVYNEDTSTAIVSPLEVLDQ